MKRAYLLKHPFKPERVPSIAEAIDGILLRVMVGESKRRKSYLTFIPGKPAFVVVNLSEADREEAVRLSVRFLEEAGYPEPEEIASIIDLYFLDEGIERKVREAAKRILEGLGISFSGRVPRAVLAGLAEGVVEAAIEEVSRSMGLAKDNISSRVNRKGVANSILNQLEQSARRFGIEVF